MRVAQRMWMAEAQLAVQREPLLMVRPRLVLVLVAQVLVVLLVPVQLVLVPVPVLVQVLPQLAMESRKELLVRDSPVRD